MFLWQTENKNLFILMMIYLAEHFRRNHEGDYHCTKLQVKAMLRDQTDNTMDMDVLDDVPISDLNYETIQGYRNQTSSPLKPAHPFGRLNDSEYLRSIGAAAISNIDK